MEPTQTDGLDRLQELYQEDKTYQRATNTKGQLRKGFSAGVDQTQAILGGAVAAVGDVTGIDTLAEKGMDIYHSNMEESAASAAEVERVEDIGGIGDALSWATYQIGKQVPNLGAMALSGGVAGGTAKVVGKKALDKKIKEKTAALVAAGTAEADAARIAAKVVVNEFAKKATSKAVLGTGVAMSTGEIAGSIEEETGEIHGGLALLSGSVAGMLEAMPILSIFKKVGIDAGIANKAITDNAMEQVTKKLAQAGKGAGQQAAMESITEGLQTIVERTAVSFVADNYEVFGEQGVSDIINAMASGGIVGGVMGIPGGLSQSMGEPTAINRATTAEAKITSLEDQITTFAGTEDTDDVVVKDLLSQHEALANTRIDEISEASKVAFVAGDNDALDRGKQEIADLRTRVKATKINHEQQKIAAKAKADEAKQAEKQTAAKPTATPTPKAEPKPETKPVETAKPVDSGKVTPFTPEAVQHFASMNKDQLDKAVSDLPPEAQRGLGRALGMAPHEAVRMGEGGEVVAQTASYYRALQKLNKGDAPKAADKIVDDSDITPQQTKAGKKAEVINAEVAKIEGAIVGNDGKPFKTSKAAESRIKRKKLDAEVIEVGEKAFVIKPTEVTQDGQEQRHEPALDGKIDQTQGTAKQEAGAKVVQPKKDKAPASSKAKVSTGTTSEPTASSDESDLTQSFYDDQSPIDQVDRDAIAADAAKNPSNPLATPSRPESLSSKTTDKARANEQLQTELGTDKVAESAVTAKTKAGSNTTKKKAEAKPTAKAKAKPAPKPKVEPKPQPKAEPVKGADNKVFTADAAAAAREVLKKKLGNLNSGIDPEVMMAGLTLAGFHIESGARSFKDYSRAMVDDLGEGISPYLRSFYESVRHYPGMADMGLTPSDQIKDGDIAPATAEVNESVNAVTTEESETNEHGTSTPEVIEAEAAKVNLDPTDGQKEAGNYKKGHIKLSERKVSIENPKGSTRSGVGPDGKAWTNTMQAHYGDFKGTVGADGDELDVFIGEGDLDKWSVFIVDQVDPSTGKFDEHKIMVGFRSVDSATDAYMGSYDTDWKGLGRITRLDQSEFSEWLDDAPAHKKAYALDKAPAAPKVHKAKTKAERKASDSVWGDAKDEAPKATTKKLQTAGERRKENKAKEGVLSGEKISTEYANLSLPETFEFMAKLFSQQVQISTRTAGMVIRHDTNQILYEHSSKKTLTIDDVVTVLASDLKRKIDADGWEAGEPHTLSRDEFVTMFGLNKGTYSFEVKGFEIGSVITPDSNGVLMVDPDALYNKVRAEAKNNTPKLPPAAPKATSLEDAIDKAFDSIKNNLQLKKVVAQINGVKNKDVTLAQMKEAQETYEALAVTRARSIAQSSKADSFNDPKVFDDLVKQYNQGPKLDVRSGDSKARQAYSTPPPMAYLTSNLAGIDNSEPFQVFENSAGNGSLLLNANPANVTVNELDPARVDALKQLGFKKVHNEDALKLDMQGQFDHYIANPPFGKMAEPFNIDGFELKQIDHAIVAKGLESLDDNGRASFIIGANRKEGDPSVQDAHFFRWLYGNYNVVDHTEADGKLYARQGAGWPVRIITVQGRHKSDRIGPNDSIVRYDTWEKLHGHVKNVLSLTEGELVGRADKISERLDGKAAANAARLLGNTDTKVGKDSDAGTRGQSGTSRSDTGKSRTTGQPNNESGTGTGQSEQLSDRADNVSDVSGRQLDKAASTAKGPRSKSDAPNGRTSTDASGTTTGNAKSSVAETDGSLQTLYSSSSKNFSNDALIPSNMAEPAQQFLQEMQDKVGDIDTYVKDRLGYTDDATYKAAFMGLQVDAVAASIYNHENGEKGVIIADQTGIGKGRQAAAMIRYAQRIGKTPVFVTVTPNLFTDMYEDAHDIGSTDIKPFILNSAQAVVQDDGNGNTSKLFKSGAPAKQREAMDSIIQSGKLPDDANVLFTTYSQFNTPNKQREMLDAIGKDAFLILDEAHQMAGIDRKPKKVGGKMEFVETTGGFIKRISNDAPTTYLSATYAKRPDNMTAFTRTSISDAIPKAEEGDDKVSFRGGDTNKFAELIGKGGAPLQAVIAHELTRKGQLIRRERSFDGISINADIDVSNVDRDVRLSDALVDGLQAIKFADTLFHSDTVKSIKESVKGAAQATGAGNRAGSTVDHSNFNSVLHNYIGQLMLGLKADYTADKAIELHKQGIKPVIALENTMGAFISDAAEQGGLASGDAFDMDYRSILLKALSRTRRVSIKPSGKETKSKTVDVPLSDVSDSVRKAYENAEALINSLDIADIPVSPIDWMVAKMEKAGINVGEITGRQYKLDYTDPANPTLAKRSPKEIKERRSTVDGFQNGQLDALILNKAGSTGLSAHNSTRLPEDQQKKRHMLVAQMSGDINILMQMLGRINRTGQRDEPDMLPEFSIMGASVPAEKRIMATALKKLSSLNANTSANTEGSTTFDAPDFLNQYGDEVVGEYLAQERDLARRLDLVISTDDENSDSAANEGIAAKATGRLAAFAKNSEQLAFYDAVEAAYKDKIDYQNSIGDNKLVTSTMDLQANIIESQEMIEKGDAENSGISGRAVLHRIDAKQLQKPPTPKIVKAAIKKAMGTKDAESYAQALADTNLTDDSANDLVMQLQNKVNKVNKLLGRRETESTSISVLKSEVETIGQTAAAQGDQLAKSESEAVSDLSAMARSGRINQVNDRDLLKSYVDLFPVGKSISVKFDAGSEIGVISGYEVRKSDKGNMYAGSQVRVEIMLASPTGKIKLPLSKARKLMAGAQEQSIDEMFDTSKDTTGREERLIITGNLLGGLDKVESGQIVRFSDQKGSTHQGILLPRYVEMDTDALSDNSFSLSDPDVAAKFIIAQPTGTEFKTDADGITIKREEDRIQVLIAKSGSTKAKDVQADYAIRSKLGTDTYTNSGMRHYQMDVAGSNVSKLVGLLKSRHSIKVVADESQRAAYVKAGGPEKQSAGSFDVSLSARTGSKGGMSIKQTGRIVKRILAKSPEIGDVRVIQSARDLPDFPADTDAEGIAGAYHRSSGRVYIIADGNSTALDVEKLLLHEAQHRDTASHFGKEIDTQLGFLAQTMMRSAGTKTSMGNLKDFFIKHNIDHDYDWYEQFGKDQGLNKRQREAMHADEALAKLAERRATLPGRVRMAINRVLATIRRWLRSHGFQEYSNLGMDQLLFAMTDIANARMAVMADAKATDTYDFDIDLGATSLQANALPDRVYSASKIKGGIGKIAQDQGLHRKPLIQDAGKDPASGKAQIVEEILAMDPDGKQQTQKEQWIDSISTGLNKMKDTGRENFNKLLSRRQLVEWGQKYLPRMSEYLRIAEQLDADRRSLQVEGNDIAVEWGTLSETQQAELAKTMQAATIAGVDPSKSYTPLFEQDKWDADMKRLKNKERQMQEARTPEGTGPLLVEIEALQRLAKQEKNREKAYPEIMKQWEKLDAPAKKVFEGARDHHTKQQAEYESAVEDQIMSELGTSKAKDRTWAKIKEEFEKNKVQEPYFPLARFGKYWVTVRYSDDPSDYSFDKFEDLDSAATFINDMKQQGHKVRFGTDVNKAMDSLSVPASFMVQVDELIGGKSKKKDRVDPKIDALRDSVYQLYLNNLPSMSARHRYQHRKEVRGFSQDALKSFADASFHGAYLVAKTRHMPKLERVMSEMEGDIKDANRVSETIQDRQDVETFRDHYFEQRTAKELKQEMRLKSGDKRELKAMLKLVKEIKTDEEISLRLNSLDTRIKSAAKINASPRASARASEYMEELRGSHERMAKPNVAKWVTTINSLGFGFFLGLTPAAALVNMTQVPMVTLPILGAKYGNKAAWAEIQKSYAEFFKSPPDGLTGLRSISNSLTGRELAAYQELARRGVIDVTQAHDLAGLAEEGQNHGGTTQKIMGKMSWMFHHAERANREVTAMSTYRLARANGMMHYDAIDEAGKQTWDTQLDYGSTNRAAVLSSNTARVLLQFKQYSAGITFLYVDTLRRSFGKNSSPEEKAEAKRALKSLLLVQFAVTGALGMPMASSAGWAIEKIVHAFSEEDDFDYEASLRQALTDMMRPVVGDAMARKTQTALTKGVFDGFTPLSIHGRLSLSSLWVKAPWKDMEGRDAAAHYLAQMAGPTYGLAENTAHGMSLLLQGDLYRGIEAMSPKFMRDTMKAGRYYDEGATTAGGNLITDVNHFEVAAQIMGFSPSALSNQYDENRAKSKRQTALTKYRSRLLRDVVDARRDRDRSGERDLMKSVRNFNKRHPEYPITSKSIKLSDKGRTRSGQATESGFRANNRMKGVLDTIDFGS